MRARAIIQDRMPASGNVGERPTRAERKPLSGHEASSPRVRKLRRRAIIHESAGHAMARARLLAVNPPVGESQCVRRGLPWLDGAGYGNRQPFQRRPQGEMQAVLARSAVGA